VALARKLCCDGSCLRHPVVWMGNACYIDEGISTEVIPIVDSGHTDELHDDTVDPLIRQETSDVEQDPFLLGAHSRSSDCRGDFGDRQRSQTWMLKACCAEQDRLAEDVTVIENETADNEASFPLLMVLPVQALNLNGRNEDHILAKKNAMKDLISNQILIQKMTRESVVLPGATTPAGC